MRVILDRGHGPHNGKGGAFDPGAESKFGGEWETVKAVAEEAAAARPDLFVLTPEESIQRVAEWVNNNRQDGDYFIVLHMNSAERPEAHGAEVVVSYNAPFVRLAQAETLLKRFCSLTGLANRGLLVDTETPNGKVKENGRKGLPILRDTVKTPGYLLEMGFITNAADVEAVREKAASALITIANELQNGELFHA